MPKFVIEREMPGAGKMSPAELKKISQKSCGVLEQPGSQRAVDPELRHGRQALLHLPRDGRVAGAKACRARRVSGQQDLARERRHRSRDRRMSRGSLPTLEQTMKALVTILAALFISPAFADDSAAADGASHRYLIERTFPAGALDGLDAATKEKVNANNATVGVRWLHTYANAEKTKTFCVLRRPERKCGAPGRRLSGLP